MAQFDRCKKKYDITDVEGKKERFILEQLTQLKSCNEVAEIYNKKFPNEKRMVAQGIR